MALPRAACVVAVAVVVFGCSSTEGPTLEAPTSSSPSGEPVIIDAVEIVDQDDEVGDATVVARATVDEVEVFTDPVDFEPARRLPNPNEAGGPLVFVVDDAQPDWLLVQLPVRPNGSKGWIKRADVELSTHDYRIEVRLRDFDLRVFDDGELIFQTVVAVARDNAPTPGGSYYITELLEPTRPDTLYGRYAYGLSGFSDTFETFRGGPGQLGIHGTNDPEALGTQVSSGCIRLHDDDIGRLVEFLPLGVPVTVFA